MIYTKLTRLALKVAYDAHSGQIDRSGIPYIFHPYHVAEQMKNELSAAAALLHDVVEDTSVTLDDLRARGFPEEITEAVRLLTRDKEDDYFEYVKRLAANPVAREVKLADLEHNSDPARLNTVTPDDLKRFEKYRKAREILLQEANDSK